MDPAIQLVAALLVLHVVEGAFLVRRQALVFVGRGRRLRIARAGVGNDRAGFVILDPALPPPVGHVVDLDPLALGPRHAVAVPPQALGRLPRGGAVLDPSDLRGAHPEGKSVRGRDGILARTSSPIAARALAETLRAYADATPEARAAALDERLDRAFDLGALRDRRAALLRETRSLAVLGPLTLVALLGSLYGVFHVPAAFRAWPYLAFGCSALIAHLGVETWSAHRRAFPEARGDRATKVALLVLSPGAAARARAFVLRDALAGFHPLAVASAVLPPDRLVEVAGPLWRDLRHPAIDPSLSAEALAALAEVRARLEVRHRALLEGAGLDVAALEAPPPAEGDDARAYCPRCRAQYAELDGDCQDCPGVARRPLVAEQAVASAEVPA